MGFSEKLLKASRSKDSLLCVGLDPEWERIPADLQKEGASALYEFCTAIVEATRDDACAYKPNAAFFEAHGAEGALALEALLKYIPRDIPIILDVKRGDIGNTARAYAKACYDVLGADAVTVSPYMGWDSVEPFARPGKGVFVLCRTSNPGGRDLQDLLVTQPEGAPVPLYEHVARQVAAWRADHGADLGLVAGATFPAELAGVRALAGEDVPLLIPGVGAQGGSPRDAVQLGGNAAGELAVVNAGRSILYAADPRKAARELKAELNRHRRRA